MLGQQVVDGKSNEITAIPELIRILDLAGPSSPLMPWAARKPSPPSLTDVGADYVLALKENQETLYNDVQQLFVDGLENDFADVEHHSHRTVDEDHGRVEHDHYHGDRSARRTGREARRLARLAQLRHGVQ